MRKLKTTFGLAVRLQRIGIFWLLVWAIVILDDSAARRRKRPKPIQRPPTP